MRRRILGALFAACSLLSIEAAAALELPFEKTQLDNGLTVIVQPDQTLPLVAVNLLYEVGARDEDPNRTGLAHLFEHLMFMGTKRAPTKTFDAWMEEAGGSNNAWTSADFTNYYEVGPPGLLPLFLWLEADRLETLGTELGSEQLDVQRDVVLNELRQRVENVPYGKVDVVLPTLLYPQGHPYHHPVIGSAEHLTAASVSDAKNFFARHYVPANAALVIAGDVDVDKAKQLAERYFGFLPAAPKPERAKKIETPRLDGIVRRTIEDRVELPKIVMAWHSPAHLTPGDAELDLFGAILSTGKASRLYQALVYEKPVAQTVEAYQWSRGLSSVFVVEILVRPGVSLDEAEAAIDAVLADAISKPPSAEDVERARNHYELAFLEGLQSLQKRAQLLAMYQALTGDPGYFEKDLERYRRATPEGILEWAKKVIDPNRRVILRVVPQAGGGQ